MKTEISNVGALRKAMADLPDDQTLYFQVVAENGDAWNLYGHFCSVEHAVPTMYGFALSHPQLINLHDVPNWNDGE